MDKGAFLPGKEIHMDSIKYKKSPPKTNKKTHTQILRYTNTISSNYLEVATAVGQGFQRFDQSRRTRNSFQAHIARVVGGYAWLTLPQVVDFVDRPHLSVL